MTIRKYITKSTTVSAVQYCRGNKLEILEFANGNATMVGEDPIIISTLDGQVYAKISDWIVKGDQGGIYSVHNDIFHKTYEQV